MFAKPIASIAASDPATYFTSAVEIATVVRRRTMKQRYQQAYIYIYIYISCYNFSCVWVISLINVTVTLNQQFLVFPFFTAALVNDAFCIGSNKIPHNLFHSSTLFPGRITHKSAQVAYRECYIRSISGLVLIAKYMRLPITAW